MSGLKRLSTRLQATRAVRTWKRFGDARGNILAAGVAYFAFFSVFPAVTLAFTVFGLVLRGNEPLRQSLTESLSTALPGVIKSSPTSSGLIEITAPSTTALTITGLVGLVTLMFAGAGWLGALRAGIRAMMGVAGTPGNMVTTKLRDLGVLFGLGLALLVSIVATTGVVSAAALVSQAIGGGDSPVLVTAAGLLVSTAVDVGIMVLLLRVLSGVSLPWPDVRQGALIGGVSFTVLKFFAGQLIALGVRNPAFGAIIGVVGLLFWLNLLSQVILLSAAWTADNIDNIDTLADHETRDPGGPTEPVGQVGGSAVPSDPAARAALGLPTFGQRTADRVTLAAGAVLGATAMAGVGALGRAWRSMRRR